MFLYNLKLNGNRLVKFMFIVMLIIIFLIFSIGIYNVFFKKTETPPSDAITLTDTIKSDEVFEITCSNYSDILQTVTNDLDSYIGCKIHFIGYVYRLIDFNENQFVLARDMIIDKNSSQSLVVGFLCNYDKASDFEDNSWVDVTGTITKGNYYGDIAQIDVTNIEKCDEPKDKFVSMPSDTYIPTSSMF